ncbi:MAG: glutaredoxin [Deltaproteobacteria bacterium]|nr:glutaredoxin [Deltaproteobacteria bacterium]
MTTNADSSAVRKILNEEKVHPAIQEKIAKYHSADIVELEKALQDHDVVVVGMGQNPVVKGVRKHLRAAGIDFHYIGHGSYLRGYRKRLVYKMYTGWPTFPMVFFKGQFIGGLEDVKRLSQKKELKELLGN